MFVRKQRAGSDSAGNTWDTDGAVVEVDDWHGHDLLTIPDGGFAEVHPDEARSVTEPAPEAEAAVTEPAPADADTTPVDEAPAKPAKRTGRRAAAE